MNIIFLLKDFWLDFIAANHSRLMKNASYETPISTLLNLSFNQGVNFNTIFILILHFLFEITLNFLILFLPIVIIALINSYYFYKKLNSKQRAEIINRKPKYKMWIYDIYFVFSTFLFMASLVLVSKYR